MNQTKRGTETLQFIFTEKDFYLDAQFRQEKGGTEEGSPENNSPESNSLENGSMQASLSEIYSPTDWETFIE